MVEPRHMEMLLDIFKSYCPNSEIWAYGSRLDGSAHAGSDLDMTVKTCDEQFKLYELKSRLSDSNIPFLLDINVFDDLPESFQKEILKNYVVIHKG